MGIVLLFNLCLLARLSQFILTKIRVDRNLHEGKEEEEEEEADQEEVMLLTAATPS